MKRSLRRGAALVLGIWCLGYCRAGAAGTLPEAENFELTAQWGAALTGQLAAADPQGDALTYFVTTGPVKGTLDLREDGSFVYTPAAGKKGRDYFGYRVQDGEGNRSQEATVIIRLVKQ